MNLRLSIFSLAALACFLFATINKPTSKKPIRIPVAKYEPVSTSAESETITSMYLATLKERNEFLVNLIQKHHLKIKRSSLTRFKEIEKRFYSIVEKRDLGFQEVEIIIRDIDELIEDVTRQT